MTKQYSNNELFEMLMAACQAQFEFNPSQVSAGMRYMGAVGPSKHCFRDTGTHSKIMLDTVTGKAQLVSNYEGRTYWDDAELEYYCQSDADIKAARSRTDLLKQSAKTAPFFLKHAPYLRTLYRGHPAYQEAQPSPRMGAEMLVRDALYEGDPDIQSFAGAMGSRDVAHLASWLLDPIGDEHEQETFQLIRASAFYGPALEALRMLLALPDDSPSKTTRIADRAYSDRATELWRSVRGPCFISYVHYVLRIDASSATSDAAT